MEIFYLEGHPHVELCDLLKFQGWSESGATAKAVIAEGLIEVNGQTEIRKRCKITAGQVVTFNGDSVCIKE
ncbi:ribosome-associated protein YbcJ [Photorhabdus heterorhabditis]|uniref:Ribosome-associated protein n=1 Tax=Photorhabdus heterorhabditis TaxID=880156 RepID=A0A5B0WDJ4_9GAMM|nr:ribosome-associated protein YbcJ [Photorhabdus heterorhabditis]KAA1184922.1 ribosome-associated protein YbcJ [Photorhabdus heterorhabditis]KOY62707.1 ribosome-associated protein [Photorhabdus heterorhabditis]MBS9442440.1 ribosome-associated protein YbcJ [Photorhabdus heterorhabditis]NRN27871.1 ribosome-associated protein YbcJ [Photorhabdus heterorhabditis subsp. aluminescens]